MCRKGLLYLHVCYAQVTGSFKGLGVPKAKGFKGKYETEIDLGEVVGEGRVVQSKMSSMGGI